LGNFIAFRSENIRNVLILWFIAMREMSSSNPFLRQMGAKRMLGLNSNVVWYIKKDQCFYQSFNNILMKSG
jgi:hypothetical protein